MRDYVYVGDLVQAHMLAIEKEKSTGQVFNVSSGKGISVEDLARKLVELSGKSLEIIFDNPEEGKASKYQPERVRLKGELRNFVLDNEKIRKFLGWEPKTSFEEGILKEIKWILENPNRWKVKPRV